MVRNLVTIFSDEKKRTFLGGEAKYVTLRLSRFHLFPGRRKESEHIFALSSKWRRSPRVFAVVFTLVAVAAATLCICTYVSTPDCTTAFRYV